MDYAKIRKFLKINKGDLVMNTQKNLLMLVLSLFFVSYANAAILWAGGEDIDFPNGVAGGGSPTCGTTSTNAFRSEFARQAIYPCDSSFSVTSNPFPGGGVTSVWLSARVNYTTNSGGNEAFIGLSKSGAPNGASATVLVGIGTVAGRISIARCAITNNATNGSCLYPASESTPYSITSTSTAYKIDMQITNYGTSTSVNVYVNNSNSPKITYTGNLVTGTPSATNLDQVIITGSSIRVSEIIVADTDTRNMSLATLAPNAAGDTNQWTGSNTQINKLTINDDNYISNNTSGNNAQFNLSDVSGTTYSVAAVKVVARATKTGSGMGSIAPGVKTNTTVSVPSPTALTTNVWTPVETIYQNNPVTTSPWTVNEVNSLQLNLQTAP
jgi:hypothetical protein